MKIQTTNDINEWFSGHIESYKHSLLDYKDKNLNEQNILLGKCVNKEFIAVEDIIKRLKEPVTDKNLFDEKCKNAIIEYKNNLIAELSKDVKE